MTTEYLLDERFPAEYDNLKKKRTINFILLNIQGSTINIAKTGNLDSLHKLSEVLDDLHCCFLIYSQQGESEDGLIRMDRIFTITYTPNLARPDEKLTFEMQKGKALSKASKGSIELHVMNREDLKRRINGVSFGASKAKKDDSDDDDNNKDWMDD